MTHYHTSTSFFKLVVLFLITTAVSFCQAQEVDKKYRLGGFVELDHISYFETEEDKVNARNQGIVQLEVESNFSTKYKFFGGVEIREDLSDPDRSRVFIDEAYVDIYFKSMDIRVGKQIITWGEADAINPTNNINPVDLSDLSDTDDERIGVYAVQGKYYVGDFTFHGVLIPVYNGSVLPKSNSRWFLDFPTTVALPDGQMAPAQFNLALTEEPAADTRSAQFALKAATSIGGWDMSISYFNGYDDLPNYSQIVTPTATGVDVSVLPKIHELEVYGFDFSTSHGSYGFRGELGYFKTEDTKGEDQTIDDSFFQYVVGIDRNFSNIIGENNLFVIVQWVHQIIESGAEVPNTNLNNIFQESILARMEYQLGNFSTLTVQGTYDFKAENYYIQPEITYEISDGLNLTVLADFFGGEERTFFGNYSTNNRAQLKLKYSF